MERVRIIVDVVFKLGLLAALGGFLYVYAASRDVGRYSYVQNGELEYVVDSATGLIYQGGYYMNHITGEEGAAEPAGFAGSAGSAGRPGETAPAAPAGQ